ncbi:MAG: hypothetical protein H8E36_00190 [Rhodospirillaceae bacterium]|nr:hypothetical protein [Rhodospirillaceae bacterium]
MKRILLIALISVATHSYGWSSEVDTFIQENAMPAGEYQWEMFREVAKNSKRPPTIDQLSKVYKKLNASFNPDTIWGGVMASSLERDVSCMKVTGDEGLCRCLGDELPAYLTFRSYVKIVTGARDLNFSGFTAVEIKQLIERTIYVREQCVAVQNKM